MSSLGKYLFRPFTHFYLLFFSYRVIRVIYIFLLLTPYQIHSLQILSHILQIAFPFVDCFLCCTEAFEVVACGLLVVMCGMSSLTRDLIWAPTFRVRNLRHWTTSKVSSLITFNKNYPALLD